MCGFGASNVIGLTQSNKFCQRRGPDLTNTQIINGVEFLHNLLSITGDMTPQPFFKQDVVCVFNGEIYNYNSFGSYPSDGHCIIDQYLEHGEQFAKHLDGEFAICIIDFSKRTILLTTDPFACKPLWYDIQGKRFCVGSYNSQLTGKGFNNGSKLKANTTKVYSLSDGQLRSEFKNIEFDIRQHKTSFDGWIEAFSRSITKRTANTKQTMFVGMSSGYDSGAIACELQKQNAPFKAYSIINNENVDVLNSRLNVIKNHEAFELSTAEYDKHKFDLRRDCEDFFYNDGVMDYSIKKDQASMGLAAICTRANKERRKIYFSGQGADEIISDYGWNGKKIYKHSGFGGLFPLDLNGFFPWHSFWDGTQVQYLAKEEYIAGHYGIETRYPFLDKDLVQEFLWLSSTLKNSKYKSALDEYLKLNGFPYQPSEKRGFHVTKKGSK